MNKHKLAVRIGKYADIPTDLNWDMIINIVPRDITVQEMYARYQVSTNTLYDDEFNGSIAMVTLSDDNKIGYEFYMVCDSLFRPTANRLEDYMGDAAERFAELATESFEETFKHLIKNKANKFYTLECSLEELRMMKNIIDL